MKAATVISVAGVAVAFVCAWNSGGGDPTPPPAPMPTPPRQEQIIWCTPVAVPLYDNGTDCQ